MEMQLPAKYKTGLETYALYETVLEALVIALASLSMF